MRERQIVGGGWDTMGMADENPQPTPEPPVPPAPRDWVSTEFVRESPRPPQREQRPETKSS
ncbi:hypothetical protein GCM10027517_11650 [Phycicoccus ginsengisoli]